MAEVTVELVGPDHWREWRTARLQSLLDSPDAFGSTYERERAFTEDDFRDRLDPAGPHVLARRADEPVGTGGGYLAAPGWCHVVAMWVSPSVRGHGVGTRILDAIVSWNAARGLRTELDVTVGNEAARRLYERYGFVATGVTRPLREGSQVRVEQMVLPQ